MVLYNHRMFVGRTQSGKTSQMLLGLAQRFEAETAGGTKPPVSGLTVIDAKGSALWLGAGSLVDKDNQSAFIWVRRDKPETILAAQRKLDYLVNKVLTDRAAVRMRCLLDDIPYRPRLHMIVIEEWLLLLSIARDYDALYTKKGQPTMESWIIRTLNNLAIGGLEDNFELWLSTQDPTTNVNRFTPDCRNNFTVSCFGGPIRGYDSIVTALRNPNLVAPTSAATLRQQLKQVLQQSKPWLVLSNAVNADATEDLFGLYRAPHAPPSLKQQRLLHGPLSYLPDGLSEVLQQAKSDSLEPLPEPSLETHPKNSNLIPFPSPIPQTALSDEAQRLVRFTQRKGRTIRLQEACNGISGEAGRAEVIRAAAQECVAAGLATLAANPKYPGSYFFELNLSETEHQAYT